MSSVNRNRYKNGWSQNTGATQPKYHCYINRTATTQNEQYTSNVQWQQTRTYTSVLNELKQYPPPNPNKEQVKTITQKQTKRDRWQLVDRRRRPPSANQTGRVATFGDIRDKTKTNTSLSIANTFMGGTGNSKIHSKGRAISGFGFLYGFCMVPKIPFRVLQRS
jgi:hypothetical protein